MGSCTTTDPETARLAGETELRYRRLLASVTDYVYRVSIEDGQPVATLHGPGCEAVTGYTPDEFAADPSLWYRMVQEADRPAVLAQAAAVLSGRPAPPLEHRILHKDGRICWIQNTPVPLKDGEGHLLAYDALVSDITERKRAEHLLSVQFAVSRELAQSVNLSEAWHRIFDTIGGILESFLWDGVAFWSFDEVANLLQRTQSWQARSNRAADFEAAYRRFMPGQGVGLPARVWTTGHSSWITDASLEPDLLPAPGQARLRGTCALPVACEHGVVGVLELTSREAQPWDADQARAWEAVANQLGQFIEHQRAEESLRHSEARLQAILDNSPAVIYLKDARGNYFLINRRYEELFHVQRNRVVGKTDFDLFPREVAEQLRANDQRVIRDRAPLEFEEVVPHDGEPHNYISVKSPLLAANGEVVALCGISTDITPRKQAEVALRESQERLALVIEGSSDGVWDWDLRTNAVYFSSRWKSMLGYEESEIANHFSGWETLLHPEDREEALAKLRAYLAGETPAYEVEHRLRHKDGSFRWILARGVALRDATGRPVRMAGSHVDLTERKAAEDRLKNAYAELARNQETLSRALDELKASHTELQTTQLQLIQAAKLDSIGTLAAGVAHEVKNPLQTILMGLDYLDRNVTGGDGNIALVLRDVRDAVVRANRIVQELLHYSAAAVFEPADEDLNALVDRALWLIQGEVTATHTKVMRQLGADLPPVRIDYGKMEQVLINILINALQAMPQGGTLTVTTRATRLGEDAWLTGPAFRQFTAGERMLVAEVQDTGTGIAEQDLPRIFDPFFTTKRVGVGTGLGLSVAKTIVDLHGGVIDLRNVPQGGVVATLVLRAGKENEP